MHNQVALITGAGKGIGKGIAIAMARAGYHIAIHYQASKQQAEDTKRQVESYGVKAALFQADIRKINEIEAMFQAFKLHFGRLDVLVNNAGVTKTAPFLETSPELFDEVVATDLRGGYFCAQWAAKLMIATQTAGTIVNISSNQSEGCWPNSSVYAAAKAGVNKLTKNIALELAPHGIRVVGIAPGYTELEWYPEHMRARYAKQRFPKIPLGRFLSTDEVGEAVVYLSSKHAGYMTGTTMFMDGGALLPVWAAQDNVSKEE